MNVGSEPVKSRGWYKEVSKDGWQSLIASGFGWFFEVFDIYILSLTLPAIIVFFSISTATAGLIGTVEAVGLIIGGIINGWLADVIGRVKALIIAILIYSIFTGLTALATTVLAVGALRFLAGMGMGGEWVAGAALVAESWPPKYRGRGGALMQMGLPLGSLFAVMIVDIITTAYSGTLNNGGWKIVYLVGALPALMLIYVALKTPESKVWLARRQNKGQKFTEEATVPHVKLGNVLIMFFFVFVAQYVYWGVFTFAPTFLVQVRHITFIHTLSFILVQQLGSLLGFIIWALVVDKIGRRPSFITYLIIGMIGTLVFIYSLDHTLIYTGAFFSGMGITGIFAGLGPWTAELVPRTQARGLFMGIAYNGGRVGGAIAPYVVGALAVTSSGFIAGLLTTIIMMGIGIVIILISKETKGIEIS
jgi:MFS family permease